MNLLLDTHVLLWTLFDTNKLSAPAKTAILDSTNSVTVSAVSLWEISLKVGLGKLELEGTTPRELPPLIESMGFRIISLDADPAASFHELPKRGHSDPFDRMLIWQAIEQRYILLSKDRCFQEYVDQGLQLIWD